MNKLENQLKISFLFNSKDYFFKSTPISNDNNNGNISVYKGDGSQIQNMIIDKMFKEACFTLALLFLVVVTSRPRKFLVYLIWIEHIHDYSRRWPST